MIIFLIHTTPSTPLTTFTFFFSSFPQKPVNTSWIVQLKISEKVRFRTVPPPSSSPEKIRILVKRWYKLGYECLLCSIMARNNFFIRNALFKRGLKLFPDILYTFQFSIDWLKNISIFTFYHFQQITTQKFDLTLI